MPRNPYAVQGMDGWVEGVLEDRRDRTTRPTTRPTTPAGGLTPRSDRGADAGGQPPDSRRPTPRASPRSDRGADAGGQPPDSRRPTPRASPRADNEGDVARLVDRIGNIQDSAKEEVAKAVKDVRGLTTMLLSVFQETDGSIDQDLTQEEVLVMEEMQRLKARIVELEQEILEMQVVTDSFIHLVDYHQEQVEEVTVKNLKMEEYIKTLQNINLELQTEKEQLIRENGLLQNKLIVADQKQLAMEHIISGLQAQKQTHVPVAAGAEAQKQTHVPVAAGAGGRGTGRGGGGTGRGGGGRGSGGGGKGRGGGGRGRGVDM